ncbi:MAG: LysM peptidoglycan-binding domain-containing protein [Spirochaetes bacterium]|nr:LysM peptidoglycan-binding domain-containing protein [Spirochaetota bacterium]
MPTSKLETKQNGDVSKKHVQLPIQPKGDEERRTSVGSNTACDNCYTVKWQDTLIKISERLSGDWRNWKKLYDLNRDAVKSTRLLIPGTQLKLPEGFNTTNEN